MLTEIVGAATAAGIAGLLFGFVLLMRRLLSSPAPLKKEQEFRGEDGHPWLKEDNPNVRSSDFLPGYVWAPRSWKDYQ